MTVGQWSFLAEYAELPRLYLALSGAFWLGTGLLVSGALWLMKPWAGKVLIWFSLAYIIYIWFDRLFVRRINLDSWVFLAIGSLLWLSFVFVFVRIFYKLPAGDSSDLTS